MAKAISKPELSAKVVIEIDESEARALDALACYGDDSFIKMFYDKLGKAYMQPYESGFRSFLKSIRSAVSPMLSDITDARNFLKQRDQERKELQESK